MTIKRFLKDDEDNKNGDFENFLEKKKINEKSLTGNDKIDFENWLIKNKIRREFLAQYYFLINNPASCDECSSKGGYCDKCANKISKHELSQNFEFSLSTAPKFKK